MGDIPLDIYGRLHELAVDLANAAMADDDLLYEKHYKALTQYCQSQVELGHAHAYLFETLADFTRDVSQSLEFYRQALVLAKASGEPIHTILVAMGEHLRDLGRVEQAEAHLEEGKTEAARLNDTVTLVNAERLLKELRRPG